MNAAFLALFVLTVFLFVESFISPEN